MATPVRYTSFEFFKVMTESSSDFSALPQIVSPSARSPWKVAALCTGVALLVAGGAAFGAWSSWVKGGTIAPGVIVQGENLAGLSADEAKARLEKRFGRLFVSVRTSSRDFDVSLAELGGAPRFDAIAAKAHQFGRSGNLVADVAGVWRARSSEQKYALPMQWDRAALRTKMWAIASQFNRKPKDASLQIGKTGAAVVPHQTGRALNVGATCAALQKKYYAGLPALEATVRETSPRLSAEDLAGRDVQLATYRTRYNAGLWGRTRNIHIAADVVDGMVLMPGQEFSFNRATGERTWDKGYRIAHIFETKPGASKAEVVDGLAGGVCQVSTTLYNAVRRAGDDQSGIKIVERNSHSLPVPYASSGNDATVAWPVKDFRFRNSFTHPVYLRAVADGGRLSISLWGRVPA